MAIRAGPQFVERRPPWGAEQAHVVDERDVRFGMREDEFKLAKGRRATLRGLRCAAVAVEPEQRGLVELAENWREDGGAVPEEDVNVRAGRESRHHRSAGSNVLSRGRDHHGRFDEQ